MFLIRSLISSSMLFAFNLIEPFSRQITEKFHESDSSSSDSDCDGDIKSASAAVKSKIYRLLSPPKIPGLVIPEDIFLGVVSALRIEFDRAFFLIRDITSGRYLKKFLAV
ncbi:Reticulon-like protein [Orobanche minor]